MLRQRAAISELFGWVQRCSVTLDRSDVQGARPIGAVIRGVGLQAHLLGSGDHAFYAPSPPLPPPPPSSTPTPHAPFPLFPFTRPAISLSALPFLYPPPPPLTPHTHFLSFLQPLHLFFSLPTAPPPPHPPLLSSFLAPGSVGCFCGRCKKKKKREKERERGLDASLAFTGD